MLFAWIFSKNLQAILKYLECYFDFFLYVKIKENVIYFIEKLCKNTKHIQSLSPSRVAIKLRSLIRAMKIKSSRHMN